MTALDAAPVESTSTIPIRTRTLRENVSRRAFPVILVALALLAAVTETQLFVVGIIVGSVLSLGALGITITYGILKFPNLSHGLGLVLGGYLTLFFLTGAVRRSAQVAGDVNFPLRFDQLPGAGVKVLGLSFGYGFLLAVVVSAIVSIGIVLLLDKVVYGRLRKRGTGSALMLTIVSFGVAYIIVGVIDIVWGNIPRAITTGTHPANRYAFGILLKPDQIFIFIVAGVLTAAAYFIIYRTRMGKAMRATTDNPALARASGINTERVIRWTWILVAVLTAVAGSLLSLQAQLNPNLGLALLLPLFAAAAVGGIGNPLGALIGGLTVGIAQEVSVAFFAPGYKIGVAFVILAIVLLVRPTGILGTKE